MQMCKSVFRETEEQKKSDEMKRLNDIMVETVLPHCVFSKQLYLSQYS